MSSTIMNSYWPGFLSLLQVEDDLDELSQDEDAYSMELWYKIVIFSILINVLDFLPVDEGHS